MRDAENVLCVAFSIVGGVLVAELCFGQSKK